MNSRERVLAAADIRQPDRIPVDFWAVDEVYDRLGEALGVSDKEDVLREVGADLRYFRGPGFDIVKPSDDSDETWTDHWGVQRKNHTVYGERSNGETYTWTYKHLVRSPLGDAKDISDIEGHPWPEPAELDYSGVAPACSSIRRSQRAVVFGGDRLDRTAQLKGAMYLRGTVQFMEDLVLAPGMAECLLEHIAAYYLEYNRRVFEAAEGKIDIFFMGDDMGTQKSLWVSPDMYRRFFKDRFRRFNELAHQFGIKSMYHTCGKVTALVGEFVDAGLDILQSLQPAAMGDDLARLKKEYGKHLCFQGGIDIQGILPHGTTAEVDAHVRDRAEMLSRGGGYIFGTAHNILPDTPTENILALVEAYHKYGH